MFRISLALLLIGFVAHRGFYSRKLAPPAGTTVVQRNEGAATKLLSLLSISALLSTMLYCLRPDWMLWSSLPFPVRLRWSGLALAATGFVLLQWSQWTLGRNWSDKPRIMTEQVLMATGPYRWIRHPIYAAFLLILSAPLFVSANWFVGGTWLGMTVLDVYARMRVEEEMLLARFGQQYATYMRRTGRLLPRLH